jgi:LmbE family N-acetylglucosaminyl deacetylase
MSHKLLVFGAHPDDCEIKAGGLAAKYAARGDEVKFVSMTNGATGHQEVGGVELAQRRYEEAQASADVIGIEYDVWDIHTGELMPTVANRKETIREIRRYDPDLVLTHRSNDYHPDHRYASALVRDAAYIVEVPNMCPLTPALRDTPVIAHLEDGFEKPYPFEGDVVVAIDDVVDEKLEMLHQHESQMYEWLAYNQDLLDEVPEDEAERKEWLAEWRLPDFADIADRFRDELIERYGEDGRDIEYAEVFEVSEYGGGLADDAVDELFPA